MVCSNIFTTLERADLAAGLRVSHSETHLEPFHRDRLFLSVYESCRHRPAALTEAANIVDLIITRLLHAPKQPGLISRDEIIQAGHDVLTTFDKAAATMYTAYHPLSKATS
jgi:transcriptional regulator NrdR family protein